MSAEIIPVIFGSIAILFVIWVIIAWLIGLFKKPEPLPEISWNRTDYHTIALTLYTQAGKETYHFGKYIDWEYDYDTILLEDEGYRAFIDWFDSDSEENWTPHPNNVVTATFTRSSILYFKTEIKYESEYE